MNVHKKSNWVFIIIPLILAGCTTIEPPSTSIASGEKITAFSHDSFNLVLQRFVNESGQIDYSALKKDPHDLDRYYQLVAAYSPDSHPDMFPTDNHKLAYWLNAYNAAAIKIVITYYPIHSVLEVRPPAPLFFLPNKYEYDFLYWFKQNYPKKSAGLLNYIALYLAPEKANELKKIEKNYTLQFIPYDWRLNDQVPTRISNR